MSDARGYVDLKMDNLKLKAIEGLSVGAGRIVTILVILMVLAIVLAAFALGCVFLLGDAIGSWAAAAFIIGGMFLLLLTMLFLFRRRLFVNMFVRLFIDIFYGEE